MAWPGKQEAPETYFIPLKHPVTCKACPVPARGWRNCQETMSALLNKGLIQFGADESTQPTRKYYLDEHMEENIPSILPYAACDNVLLIPFDNPKPIDFIQQIMGYFLSDSDGGIVLEMFAGSGTMAHACMKLNAERGGHHRCRWIVIQYPEPILAEKKAQLAAYRFCTEFGLDKNIAAIARERLRRAIREIKENNSDSVPGFKVFRVTVPEK